MEWSKIENIWLLIFAVAFAASVYFIYQWKNNIRKNFADVNLIEKLLPNISLQNYWIKSVLVFLSIIFIILSLLDPLYGVKKQNIKREGIDILFALDVSNSMNTEDVAPSRLEKSKRIIGEITKLLGGDRVGLVLFAGEAYSASPLTNDYAAIESILESTNTDLFFTQGTNTGAAIFESLQLLNINNNRAKVIVLISDGENHEPEINEQIELALNKNVQIISIGVGTKKGGPVPVLHQGIVVDYKKDRLGNNVISRLEEKNLTKIATKTNGKYIQATQTKSTVNQAFNTISSLEKTQYGAIETKEKNHVFQWFLGIAIMLLFIDSLTSEKKLFS